MMKPFVLPILLLVALSAIFIHLFLGSSPPGKPENPNNGHVSSSQIQVLPQGHLEDITLTACEAIEDGKFLEAKKILEPVKGENDVLIKTLWVYSRVCGGDSLKHREMDTLEKDVLRDARLESVFYLSQIFSKLGNKEKRRELLSRFRPSKLPPDLRKKVLMALGDERLKVNDENAALVFFKTVIQDFPKYEKAYSEVFNIFQKIKNQEDLKEIRKTGDLYHSKNFEYNLSLGKLLLHRNKPKEAAILLKKSQNIKPGNPAPTYFLAQSLDEMDDKKGALKEAEKLLKLDQPFPEGLIIPRFFLKCAISAKNSGFPKQAFCFYLESILSDPTLLGESDEGVFGFVQDWIKANGTEEEKLFSEAFSTYLAGYPKKTKDFLIAKAGLIREKKLKRDSERLLNECKRIIRREEDYLLALKREREEEERKEELRLRLLTPEEEPAESKAPSFTPNYSPGTPTLVINPRLDPDSSKIQKIMESSQANSGDWKAHFSGGFQLASLGEIRGAKLLLRGALRANPNLAEAYLALGKLAQFEGNFPEALESLERASKIAPEDQRIRCGLAETLADSGKVPQALSELDTVIGKNPENYEANLVRARIYCNQKKFDEALNDVRHGLRAIDRKKDPASAKALTDLYNQIRAKK